MKYRDRVVALIAGAFALAICTLALVATFVGSANRLNTAGPDATDRMSEDELHSHSVAGVSSEDLSSDSTETHISRFGSLQAATAINNPFALVAEDDQNSVQLAAQEEFDSRSEQIVADIGFHIQQSDSLSSIAPDTDPLASTTSIDTLHQTSSFIQTFEKESGSGFTFSGMLIGDDGVYRSGVEIYAKLLTRGDSSNTIQRTTRYVVAAVTDARGRFRFGRTEKGTYSLRVNKSDNYQSLTKNVNSASGFVSLVTPRSQQISVTGLVTDIDGSALGNVEVAVSPGSGRALTDDDGRFELEVNLYRDTEYHFTFNRENFQRQHQVFNGGLLLSQVDEGFEVHAELEYEEIYSSIFGSVTNQYGAPVSDQLVVLSSRSPSYRFETESDASGQYQLNAIPVGDYRIGVIPDNSGAQYKPLVKDVQVGLNTQELDLVLERVSEFGSLAGSVIDSEGNPVSGFDFVVSPKSAGRRTLGVSSDALGEFFVPRVPAGMIQIRSNGQPNLSVVNIHLRPGEAKRLDIPVDWGEHTIGGRLLNELGQPVRGASVRLIRSTRNNRVLTTSRRSSKTDIQGGFGFSNLGEGDYSLSITSTGFEPIRQSVSVKYDRSLFLVAKSVI